MDNASDFESEDCEFESRRGQNLFFLNICSAKYTHHYEKESASARGRTVDLRFTRPTPYHLATKAYGDKHWNNTENVFLFGSNLPWNTLEQKSGVFVVIGCGP